MTSPHCAQESNDGVQSACIAIYFLISFALSAVLYWTSWVVSTNWDFYWQILAYCAPLPAAVWLGACAASLSARWNATLGLIAGSGGFLLHLLVYSSHEGDVMPDNWVRVLCAFVAAGIFLSLSGHAAGRTFFAREAQPEVDESVSGHARKRPASRPPSLIYVQTVLGFLGPIIVAIIDLRNR